MWWSKDEAMAREVATLRTDVQILKGQNSDLARELMGARRAREVAEAAERRLPAAVEANLKRLREVNFSEGEMKFAMGEIDDADTTYMALMKVLQAQEEVELSVALQAGLKNEDRQFASGRASVVADLVHMIEGMRVEGRRLRQEANSRERT